MSVADMTINEYAEKVADVLDGCVISHPEDRDRIGVAVETDANAYAVVFVNRLHKAHLSVQGCADRILYMVQNIVPDRDLMFLPC